MVIPADWDFAADDHDDVADTVSATGVHDVTGGDLLSGATDKTVRVPTREPISATAVEITLSKYNCAYPSETDSY